MDVAEVKELASAREIANLKEVVVSHAVPIVLHTIGALLLWVVGRWGINLVLRLIRVGAARRLDATLVRYLESATQILLSILLLLAVLGVFGVETTSFAGVIAATGVAVGMAWSGLLSNFAAGVFILALRPFRVGDQVMLAGVTGVVQEIGMFNTALDTGDNVRTWIGNNKAMTENIMNYSVNGWRRVEVKLSLPAGIDVFDAMAKLQERVAKVPHVLPEPKPTTYISSLDGAGTVAVQVSSAPNSYPQVLDGVTRVAAELLKEQRH